MAAESLPSSMIKRVHDHERASLLCDDEKIIDSFDNDMAKFRYSLKNIKKSFLSVTISLQTFNGKRFLSAGAGE